MRVVALLSSLILIITSLGIFVSCANDNLEEVMVPSSEDRDSVEGCSTPLYFTEDVFSDVSVECGEDSEITQFRDVESPDWTIENAGNKDCFELKNGNTSVSITKSSAGDPVKVEINMENNGRVIEIAISPDNCTAEMPAEANSYAEAQNGTTVIDHDCVTAGSGDAGISSFALSMAKASSGEHSSARATSSVKASGGSSATGSAIAITK